MRTPIEGRRAGAGWPKRYGKWVDEPNAEQRRVLQALYELGDQRAELYARRAYMTSSGRRDYDQVLARIRARISKGVELGISHDQMRTQLGIAKNAYLKIKSGVTGR